MPRRSKKDIVEQETVVFAFEKIDKIDEKALSLKNYQSVHTFLKTLVSKQGLKSDKIGFGGYISDIAFYLSCVIENKELDTSLFELQTDEPKKVEYDPDILPSNIWMWSGSCIYFKKINDSFSISYKMQYIIWILFQNS